MIVKDENYYEEVFSQILANMEKNMIIKEKTDEPKLIVKYDEKLDEICLECKRSVREISEKRKSMVYFNSKTKICMSCRQKAYHQNYLKKKNLGK